MSELRFANNGDAFHKRCGTQVMAQYDTGSEEGFWHCWECDESFTLGGREAFYFTSTPMEGD